MPPLHVILFKQLPIFSKNTAHWALFLPNEDGDNDGVLFHITKESLISWKTQYQQKEFSIGKSADRLESTLVIWEINVSVVSLDAACQRVTKDRGFHVIKQNCQHWVCEVATDLAQRYNLGDIDVLGRIKKLGYKPLVKSKTEKNKNESKGDLNRKQLK
jgi:hypothetical protein